MATKLRTFTRNKILKILSFSLVVILITASSLQWFYLHNRNINPEVLFVQDYDQSETYHRKVSQGIRDTINQIVYDIEKILPEPEYLYYVSDGEKAYYNASLSHILDHEKYLYKYVDQSWEYGEHTYNNIQYYFDENLSLYLTFTEEYMEQKQQEWEDEKTQLLPIVISIFTSITVAILLIIYLILVTGRKPEDDEVHLTPYMDMMYSDIQLGIMIFPLMISYSEYNMVRNYGNSHSSNVLGMDQILVIILSAFTTIISTIILGVILLSLVRKIKAKRLIKHSLVYAIFSGISKFIRSFFDDSRFEHFPLTKSLDRRQLIFTSASGVMVFTSFIFLLSTRSLFIGMIPVFIEAIIIYWYFNENRKTFKEINQGFQASLQEQMKSERMKVDLITNVSHDLKTPLTSIISYVDLLSKEDLPESAKDYVNILADKSGRLKNIVSDLFDLAKSTSGSLPLDMKHLDLKKLIQQTLGDMEDEIEKSGISIKESLSATPVYIYSDGKKLYRVFQNIIGNALKYSMQGTRIFIDMKIDNNIVEVTIKNTASYPMDFTAEEILQRFTRGDEARTSEGSGLGLSIAESFTWASGGRFQVEIDGDQFKVILKFPVNGVELVSGPE
ncbi:MAG TPA: HAMP domain-containing histidine kinase [Clostridiales bacterium]|nr:HAMP domain-containing histidine kinase [Clostridiales bacterium]